MSIIQVSYNKKPLTLHKSITEPNFESKTVLDDDPWLFVEMWLKSNNHKDALFYWQQAHDFFKATKQLPVTSAPLTGYYCILNATKTLLLTRGIPFTNRHGVSGTRNPSARTELSNEQIRIQRHGVVVSLCQLLDSGFTSSTYSYTLKDILYNLPYIHRTYNLTYESQEELFIPIENPHFLRNSITNDTWFVADIDPDKRHSNKHTINKLPSTFSQDNSVSNYRVKYNSSFLWTPRNPRIINLKQYHRELRKSIYYINSPKRLWYLKRSSTSNSIDRSTLTLTFIAMHRLSELSRYNPVVLEKHLTKKYNWLISDFIKKAPNQFIDEISAEITGTEVMSPRIS